MLIGGMRRFDTQDSLYDTAWSEIHENQIAVACGDGSVKLFDISLENYPVQSWQEHNREVYSVSWNLVSKDTFASSSWDGTIKVVCLPSAASVLCLTKVLQTVVPSPPPIDPHAPYTLMYIQQCLLSTLAVSPLLCFIRLALANI
jgi:peroxin-7